MRLFVAVDVPEDLKQAIEDDVVEPLRDLPGARWTRPDGRHLTLAFLGESEDVDGVIEALRAVSAEPFDAAFDEIGAFPHLRRPRVLWCGIGEGRDAMVDLAGVVQRALVPTGFVPDTRPFHPHLTLARFPQPRAIGEVPAVTVPGDRFNVSEIVLFRTQLHSKGARYTPLATFTLRGQVRG